MAVRLSAEMTSSLGVNYRFRVYDDSYASSAISVTCNDFQLSYNGSNDDLTFPVITSELTLPIYDDGTSGISTAITSIETSDEKNIRITMERDTGSGYELYWAGILLKDSIIRYNEPQPTEIVLRAVCGLTRLKEIEFDEAADGTYSSNQTALQYVLDALDYNGLSVHWGASDDYFRESIEWYDSVLTTPAASDSPLLYTRFAVEHFIIKDDNESDRVRTAWDVVYKIMELWCAQIFLCNGAYYIRQIRNYDTATHTIRGIDKSLTVNNSNTVSNDVATVTGVPSSEEVRIHGGGEYYRLSPLHEVVATVQPQKYINYVKNGDKSLTYSNDPQTLTYSMGALRGGAGSLKFLKVQYRMKSVFDDTVTPGMMAQYGIRMTVNATLTAGGTTYYLEYDEKTGVFTWETSPASAVFYFEGSEWGEAGRYSFLYAEQFVTPEIPSSAITSSTLILQFDVWDFKAGAVSGSGSSGMKWIIQDAYIYLIDDGSSPRSTEVRIPNPTSSDNSDVQNLGELWLNDLSIVSGKNQFETWDGATWGASTTIDEDYTDTNLVYTMLYERMALRRLPVLKYRGKIDGDYDPWEYIVYGSEALIFMNGTLHGGMDEWEGEWFDFQRNATNVGSTKTERDWRSKEDDIDWTRTPKTPKWVKKYSVHERIATLGADYLVSSGATTSLTLFAAVNHENLKADDKVYLFHPLTMEELDSFTLSSDVIISDTSLSVDSKTPSEDCHIGSLVMIKRDELTASEGVRGQQFMVNGQKADSGVANRAIFESSDSGQLSYKNSSGVVAPLGEMVTETTLSQAQIQSLGSSPVEIVAAAASGYYHDVQRITIFYDHNGTEYSGTVGATLEAEYSATSTRVAFDTSDIFLQGADYNGQMTIDNIYHNSGLRDLSNMDGSAIRLTNSVSYTGSGGTATVRVYYKTVEI